MICHTNQFVLRIVIRLPIYPIDHSTNNAVESRLYILIYVRNVYIFNILTHIIEFMLYNNTSELMKITRCSKKYQLIIMFIIEYRSCQTRTYAV